MPKYRTPTGVVVDVPQETATLIGGFTPVDDASPPPAKRATRKPKPSKPEQE